MLNLQKLPAKALFFAGLTSAGLASLSVPAFAGSAQTQFQISATVAGSCSISATDVNLGAYVPGASTLEGTGTIGYQCTPGLSPAIALDNGLYSPNPNNRILVNNSSSLSYQIYQDSGYSTVWGDGTNGSSVESVTADGNNDTTTVYVAVPTNITGVVAGTYSDTVTATISW